MTARVPSAFGGPVIDGRAGRVLLDRRDGVHGGSLLGVRLAGRHDLTVAGDQVEPELAVAGLVHDKLHFVTSARAATRCGPGPNLARVRRQRVRRRSRFAIWPGPG